MRLAVFTNQFPSRLAPFFARDMRSLLDAGVELDVFPLYPLDPNQWVYVADVFRDQRLPPDRVHHIPLRPALDVTRRGLRRLPGFLRDATTLTATAWRYGPVGVAKTAYAALKAWTWAERAPRYDHVLAYWGSYVATCAYMFHRLTDSSVPFSMFVRANADLYLTPIHLARKLLYADNVLLNCEFNRQYLRERYDGIFPRIADKIQVHYTGLDLRAVPFDANHRPPRKVLAVGRFVALKGFPWLIRALHMLHQRGCAVDLELIGSGDLEPELRRLIAQLGLERHVRIRGWILPDQVLAAMREATLLVHSSVGLDALPNVVKEAMAVGTPVIASDMAGVPELLDGGRCGLLVPPGDVGALADAIERLVGDPELRDRYARAARAHIEAHFDLQRNGRHLAERLRATVRSNGRP